MLTGPSFLGHIIAGSGARTYHNADRDAARDGRGGPPSGMKKAPLPTYGRRKDGSPMQLHSQAAYVTRRCHQYADHLYQQKSPANRKLWRDAVKRPGYSAYDLWMSEALTLLNQGKRPPDVPSHSGGFNTERVIEGTEHDVAPCFAGPFLLKCVFTDLGTQPGQAQQYTTYRFHWHTTQYPLPTNTYAILRFRAFWNPDAKYWDWNVVYAPIPWTLDCATYKAYKPYIYWEHLSNNPPDLTMRRYKGQMAFPGTWFANCPEQGKWAAPPLRTYPIE